jgi:hypothetical protein
MSSDSEDTPTLPAIIRAQVARVIDGIRGPMPGRVVSYDAKTQEASVQPLLKVTRINESGKRIVDTLPVINHVPVAFLGTGAYSITWPVKKGDTVLLLFAEQSLDAWLVNDGIVDPQGGRRFHISDAIAIPGMRSFRNALDNPDTNALVITANKVKLGSKNAADPVALKSDLDTIKPAILAGIDGQISALTPGLPATSGDIATLTALRAQISASWPVCAQKVDAE